MSLVLENSSDLIDLGDAIRSKTGGSSNLTVAQMATAVNGISTGGGLDLSSITWAVSNKFGDTQYDSTGRQCTLDLTNYITDLNNPNYMIGFTLQQMPNQNYKLVLYNPIINKWFNPENGHLGLLPGSTIRIDDDEDGHGTTTQYKLLVSSSPDDITFSFTNTSSTRSLVAMAGTTLGFTYFIGEQFIVWTF